MDRRIRYGGREGCDGDPSPETIAAKELAGEPIHKGGENGGKQDAGAIKGIGRCLKLRICYANGWIGTSLTY